MNIGFVLRTDTNLNAIWTIEVDNSGNGTFDYNMVNNVIETSDGYLLTGAINDPNSNQQAVLARKIDASGGFVWDASYVMGNAADVSVDAYYDSGSNKIYMLSNYSVMHHFGITVLNNTSGAIMQSFVEIENSGNLNYYGFTIDESFNGSNYLVVTGYNRQSTWYDANANSVTSQSNVFVFEFDKTNGNQVGHPIIYRVPHTEITTDEYNFWNGQMPLIYYPQISASTAISISFHNVIGYRTPVVTANTEANLFRTLPNYENTCLNDGLDFTPNTINYTAITNVMSGSTPITPFPMTLNYTAITVITSDCNGNPLSINENDSLDNNYMYPNPASSKIFTSNIDAHKYQIYDVQGRKVLEGTINQDQSININSLSKGVYMIKIINDTNQSQIFKVVKE
jgi:hypothetical protein